MKGNNKILIVDNDRSHILTLNNMLKSMYTVLAAKDGKSALRMVKENMPDLILLDVVMPDMTGFDVLVELKRGEKTRKIPVIFITGLDDPDDEEKGLDLGAVDYITKPFKESIVKVRIKTQLQIIDYIHQIENFGIIDHLTKLHNRRYFDHQINLEWHRAMREKEPLSILLIDIDNFKTYNDTYSHMEGDRLLKAIAEDLTKPPKRATDMVARWGGEEFVVLLPNSEKDGAMFLGELIRQKIEQTSFICRDGTHTTITVSIGVSTKIPAIGDTIIDFMSMADKALYKAKNTGRNRVCFE